MPIAAKIEAVLRANLGRPMSVAELSAAIPQSLKADVAVACERLRRQARLGRNGANTPAKPHRFYLKNFGNLPPTTD